MPRIFFTRRGPMLTFAGAAVLYAASASVWAQTPDKADPVQWHQEDATPEARYQTARKEAGAAFEEQKKECRTQAASVRQQCMKEARQQWKTDLERAKTLQGALP